MSNQEYLKDLNALLEEKQKAADFLAIARLYETLGWVNLGTLFFKEKISYWKTETIPFFEAMGCFIKATKSYVEVGHNKQANNVADQAILFLKMAVDRESFDEKILNGLAFELIGDLLHAKKDIGNAKNYYKQAGQVYRKIIAQNEPDFEDTWQVQEEFESTGAIVESPTSNFISDIHLLKFVYRVNKKTKMLSELQIN